VARIFTDNRNIYVTNMYDVFQLISTHIESNTISIVPCISFIHVSLSIVVSGSVYINDKIVCWLDRGVVSFNRTLPRNSQVPFTCACWLAKVDQKVYARP
jgi:hypothetical protein